ncbi:MAG: hypothetical protein WCN98_13315, partial [Verrucomicrobiaceae bacterium]
SSVAATADRIGIPSDTAQNITEALAKVRELDLDAPPRILITGSLYLAGETLANLTGEHDLFESSGQ